MNEFKACKECTTETGRHVGCHATCERHHQEKEAHRQNMKKREVDREYNSYRRAAIARRPSRFWK